MKVEEIRAGYTTLADTEAATSDWHRAELGDIAQVIRGVTYKKEQATSEPATDMLPILRATNVQDGSLVLDSDLVFVPKELVSETQKLRVGDIVVATSSGSKHLVGKTAQVREAWEGSFGAFCAAIRPTGDIDQRYLGYFFETREYKDYITKKALGVNINNLRRGDLEEISVPVAPIDQQKRIVEEIEKQFSRLDKAVAHLKRVKANLKRYKAAVLKAAVEGRLAETEAELARCESRSYETGEQLLKRILEIRRSRWTSKGIYKEPAAPDTTQLPILPEGWVWATIEQLSCLVEYGSSAKTGEDSTGIPVLRMGNIVAGELVFDKLKYLPIKHREFPKLLLEPGDLLFNRTNSPELVGKTALYRGLAQDCSFASYLIRVRTVVGCSPMFIAAYINSVHGRNWAKSVVTQQVGQANINGSKLQALIVPLPPEQEQHRVVLEVERCFSRTQQAERLVETTLTRAERLRQSLLRKGFWH